MIEYDIIVIGSGGGTKLAKAAAGLHLKTALIEYDDFGGTCLNRGCIPSKMLIYPAELIDSVKHADRLGISLPAGIRSDFGKIIERINDEVSKTSNGLRRDFSDNPFIDVIHGKARFLKNHILEVNGKMLSAPKIFIATGSRPHMPDIAGLEVTPYMTSRDALKNRKLPKRMLVVGAGYIAAELGYAYAAHGCDVQFVVRSAYLRHEDLEIQKEFDRIFSGNHTTYRGHVPESVEFIDNIFRLRCRNTDGETCELEADALLIATGVIPNSDDMGLGSTGIRTNDNGYIVVDECMQTDVEGIYALGDVVGNYFFRHTVNYEAEYLIKKVLNRDAVGPLDYGPVAHAVFTHPQIAGVGATEEYLREMEIPFVVGRATYADSAPGMARMSDHGLAKILIEAKTGKLLGAHIIGDDAADILHLFIAMMKKEATLGDLRDLIFIHPALAEVARDAVRNAVQQS